MDETKAIIEAVLFAAGREVSLKELQLLLEKSKEEIEEIIQNMNISGDITYNAKLDKLNDIFFKKEEIKDENKPKKKLSLIPLLVLLVISIIGFVGYVYYQNNTELILELIYGKNIYSDEGSAPDLIYILSDGKSTDKE